MNSVFDQISRLEREKAQHIQAENERLQRESEHTVAVANIESELTALRQQKTQIDLETALQDHRQLVQTYLANEPRLKSQVYDIAGKLRALLADVAPLLEQMASDYDATLRVKFNSIEDYKSGIQDPKTGMIPATKKRVALNRDFQSPPAIPLLLELLCWSENDAMQRKLIEAVASLLANVEISGNSIPPRWSSAYSL